MTSLVIEAAMERARQIAIGGDATTFENEVQSILSLDRLGEAPVRELRMLAVVAAARRADLEAVDETLASLSPLAPSDWATIHRWMLAAPDMQHETYSDFVRDTDRRMRSTGRIPPAKKWTPVLAALLIVSIVTLLVIGYRLANNDPSQRTHTLLSAVLRGETGTFLSTLPPQWQHSIDLALTELRSHDTAAEAADTLAAIDSLHAALSKAAASHYALHIARQLLSDHATPGDLAVVAQGILNFKDCPWLQVSQWGLPAAWEWKPSSDGERAYGSALRHMPLAVWLPGCVSPIWKLDPMTSPALHVRVTGRTDSTATVTVQVGFDPMSTPVMREQGCWLPQRLIERWPVLQAELAPERCTQQRAQEIQQSIARSIYGCAAWIDRLAGGSQEPAPTVSEVAWWVP